MLGLRYAVPTLVNALKADSTLATLVNPSAIFPLIKTLDAIPFPCISVTRTGWYPQRVKAGLPYTDTHSTIGTETLTLTVNIYAKSYDASNEVAEATVNALDGKSFTLGDFKLDSVEVQSINETVIGSDMSVFNQTLTLQVKC